MRSSHSTFPEGTPDVMQPAAGVFEVAAYLCVVGIATLCFMLGWLTPNAAGVVTVLLLSGLTILSWRRFSQGRHPCFLFLGMLLFFQGGRLLVYCLGNLEDPLRIVLQTPVSFSVTRDQKGIVLLLLALSALCVYAPCRWRYRPVPPPDRSAASRYLHYFYWLFYATLPVQLFKNYRYYQYAQEHGGYLLFWVNHAAFTASVPIVVRVISLVSFPAFVAIFVLEYRRKYLYAASILYFATASLILLMGSRGAFFGLIVALWYVARVKSTRKTRLLPVALLALSMVLVADVIQTVRGSEKGFSAYSFLPLDFLASQGISLDVTEIEVAYQKLFQPYLPSYLYHELLDAFVSPDYLTYSRGSRLSFDVSVLLNSNAFASGHGTSGSYVGEAYVIGGVAGVVMISLLIGGVLHLMYRLSHNAFSLFLVAMVLPDFLSMPRGQLLDWVSALLRNAISLVVLAMGWSLYRLMTSINRTQEHRIGAPKFSPGEA